MIRPLDLLKDSIGKRIRILMRKEKMYSGVLVEFDEHVNIFMEDLYETDGNCTYKIGRGVVNGGTIAMIDIE